MANWIQVIQALAPPATAMAAVLLAASSVWWGRDRLHVKDEVIRRKEVEIEILKQLTAKEALAEIEALQRLNELTRARLEEIIRTKDEVIHAKDAEVATSKQLYKQASIQAAAESGRRLELETQIRADDELARQRIVHLQNQLMSLQEQRSRYEDFVGLVASRSSVPVHHHAATLTYTIGETGDGDRATEEYTSAAADPLRPLLWFDLRVGITGLGVRKPTSFGDLHDVAALQEIDDHDYALPLVPAGIIDGRVRGLAVFHSEITADPRNWRWSYRWAMWEPLRRTLRDTLGFEVFRNTRYGSLRIRIAFPPSLVGPMIQPLEPDENLPQADLMVTEDGTTVASLELQGPSPGHYVWSITVERFDGPSHD